MMLLNVGNASVTNSVPPRGMNSFSNDPTVLGIDHLTATNVHPNVGDGVLRTTEEDQITLLDVLVAHMLVLIVLSLGSPGNALRSTLLVDVAGETRAVKARRTS